MWILNTCVWIKGLHNTSVTQQPKYEYSSMPDNQFSFAYTIPKYTFNIFSTHFLNSIIPDIDGICNCLLTIFRFLFAAEAGFSENHGVSPDTPEFFCIQDIVPKSFGFLPFGIR